MKAEETTSCFLFDHLQTSSVRLIINKTADPGSGVRGPDVPGLQSDTVSLQASHEQDGFTERTYFIQ